MICECMCLYTHYAFYIILLSRSLFSYLYYELSVTTKYSLEILNVCIGYMAGCTPWDRGHCCTRGGGWGPCENMNGRGCGERF